MDKHRDLTNPNSFRSRVRAKRVKYLVSLVEKIIDVEGVSEVNICDLGGTNRYWRGFPFDSFSDVKFKITLINIEEKKFAEPLDIPNVTLVSKIGDACNMTDTADGQYHLSHSNSVIEHVGNWSQIKKFAAESKRIGKYHFIQTPNFWFPIEPHYVLPVIQFMPRPWHTRMVEFFKKKDFDKATAKFDDARMLSKRELKFLFAESKFIKEKFILLNKSFIAHS